MRRVTGVGRLTTTAATAVLVFGGCGDDTASSPGRAATELIGDVRVFAAASLTDVFAEIESGFERLHPEVDVQVQVAGSSTLREQILEGAPADVFASANEDTMDALVERGAVEGTPRVFARNRLTIAVPAGNPGRVDSLADLADPDLLVGLCAEGVPCGDLARSMLTAAGVEPSVDTDERDVRALLTKIAADELDAGIVYVTDIVVADGAVEAVAPPDDVATEARYPIAVLADAPRPDAAAALVAFVLGGDGQAILAAYGFGPP